MSHWDDIAAKILEWWDLQAYLSFLRDAAEKTRIHPDWSMLTKKSRLTASNPSMQNVKKAAIRPLMPHLRNGVS
jgi:hypothetical protein